MNFVLVSNCQILHPGIKLVVSFHIKNVGFLRFLKGFFKKLIIIDHVSFGKVMNIESNMD